MTERHAKINRQADGTVRLYLSGQAEGPAHREVGRALGELLRRRRPVNIVRLTLEATSLCERLNEDVLYAPA